MLTTDAKRLRWCGIDMHSRSRRRVAVVATYAVFLGVVWVHPGWARNVLEGVWGAWFLTTMWSAVAETELPTRVVFTALWALILGVQMWGRHGKADGNADLYTVLWAAFLLVFVSIVSWGGMAALRDTGWVAQEIEQGEKLSWRRQRRLARLGYAVGLDGFAWYEFTKRYKDLDAENRVEVEELRRANPRGRWMRERERTPLDDERMRQEDNVLRAKVQRTMSWILMLVAIAVSFAVAQGWTLRRDVLVAGVWTLAALMVTLRQAIVLWMEDDPRAVGGEIELVEREA
jgi:hypothetical protein